MILEDAHRLAHRHDYSQLAVRIIVGHQIWPPKKKIVRPPTKTAMQLVVYDFGQRGRVDLTRYERLVGRKRFIHVVIETVVPLLAEMQREVYHEQKRNRAPEDNTGPLQCHSLILAFSHMRRKAAPDSLAQSALSYSLPLPLSGEESVKFRVVPLRFGLSARPSCENSPISHQLVLGIFDAPLEVSAQHENPARQEVYGDACQALCADNSVNWARHDDRIAGVLRRRLGSRAPSP